jgi:hypothetical protein
LAESPEGKVSGPGENIGAVLRDQKYLQDDWLRTGTVVLVGIGGIENPSKQSESHNIVNECA